MPTKDAVLERHFGFIGARARLGVQDGAVARLNIRRDGDGEFFDLRLPDGAVTAVLDADRRRRHLLLLVNVDGDKSRYLCGHDERHWFVAAIPESERGVVNVVMAQHALMPVSVREAASRMRTRQRFRRRNPAFVRQGEWFFVPVPDLKPTWWLVLRNEPLSRGRGQFHIMEFAYRRGGIAVYVNRAHPGGITQDEYDALPESERQIGFRRMTRDAEVYASGRVSHPDHASVVLRGWHRVFVNTEGTAKAMRHLAFLD
jgi:hypothetical protein